MVNTRREISHSDRQVIHNHFHPILGQTTSVRECVMWLMLGLAMLGVLYATYPSPAKRCSPIDDLLSPYCLEYRWFNSPLRGLVFFETLDARLVRIICPLHGPYPCQIDLTLPRITLHFLVTLGRDVLQIMDVILFVSSIATQFVAALIGIHIPWPIDPSYITNYYRSTILHPVCLTNGTACAFPVRRHGDRPAWPALLFSDAVVDGAMRPPYSIIPARISHEDEMDYLIWTIDPAHDTICIDTGHPPWT